MANRSTFNGIFAGLVAYVLLGLYVSTLFYIILGVLNCTPGECRTKTFAEGIVYVVTTIGGLVSALVISRLTLTDPQESVVVKSGRTIHWTTLLELAYLVVWLVTGLGALIIGVMIRPDVNTTLSDIGTTWLGLAVASGFSYFGLRPSANNIKADVEE